MAEQDPTPHRSGMVALVGRPNVGKSTLMNALVGDKVSIITPVAQTTRNQIRGIQNLDNSQIVYLDTPGIHHARKALNRYMVDVALRALSEVDLVLYLVDASRPDPAIVPESGKDDESRVPGYQEDVFILRELRKAKVPVFLVVNKIDRVSDKSALLPLITNYNNEHSFEEVIPISALADEGLDILVSEISKRLPEGPPLFPAEFSTDMAERFLVAEMIREKLILHTRQELPHSTAVMIEGFDESEREPVTTSVGRTGVEGTLEALASELVTPAEDLEEHELPPDQPPPIHGLSSEDEEAFDAEMLEAGGWDDEEGEAAEDSQAEPTPGPRRGLVRIDATIVVERSSQKGIVIGKRGSMLKTVGSEAREDIEALLGCRVFLQLWVRVAKNWSKNEKALRQLGYRD